MDFFKYLQDELHIYLNEQQTEAVRACDRRLLLEACPGSGKTTTLVARIAYQILCCNIKSSQILTLTFSRASAHDMERRFISLFGSLITQPVHFSTIHSFCYRFLYFCQKKRVLTVPDLIEKQKMNGKMKIIRSIFFDANQEYPGDDQTEQLSNEISFVKNKLINPEQFVSDFENFSIIYQRYESYKKENQLIDFDDMLSMAYGVLCENRKLYKEFGAFRYVHVDEVQDTSLLQHRIIEELSRDGNLFMVGDTDQSIYGFRGAEPEYIVDITSAFPDARLLRLETNYRSSKKIVQLADQFIRQNETRHQKNMSTINDEGQNPEICLMEDMEEQLSKIIEIISAEPSAAKTAVLYRNNLSGLPVVWELIQKGLPFFIREDYASFFRHFVVADVFAFFSFATDHSDMDSFMKIYYKMNAAISKNDVHKLREKTLHTVHPAGKTDILSELLHLNQRRRHIAEHIVRIRKALNKIVHASPYKALQIMEQELQYGEYLKRNAGFLRVFFTLKHFARNTRTVEEFKTKLRTLKNGIDQYYRKAQVDSVHLLTLHGSKGLEFDAVILMDLTEGIFPDEKSIEDLFVGNRKNYEEEVRLFYVGVTRARKRVYLLSSLKQEGKKTVQSRFIHQFLDYQQSADLGEGQIVHHLKFGEGVVKSCDNDVVEILFKKYGYRKLSIKICLESGMLKVE